MFVFEQSDEMIGDPVLANIPSSSRPQDVQRFGPNELVLSMNWVYCHVRHFRKLVVFSVDVGMHGDNATANNGGESEQGPDAGIAVVRQAV